MTSRAATPPRRRARLLPGLALALTLPLLLGAPGCAAMTGLVTGAFTGAVDAPMQVYRYNRTTFDLHPVYWTFNVLFIGPLGFAAGPLVGFAKGMAIDVQWLLDQMSYGRSFGTYRDPSIWRPYTLHWLRY